MTVRGEVWSDTSAYIAGEPDCSVRALLCPAGSRLIESSGVGISHSREMAEARGEVYKPPM